jgi:hypothetical protein
MKATVSVFKNFVNKIEDKPLEEILNDIKKGTYRSEISEIRTFLDNDKKNEAAQLKKQLDAFTVSGTFSNGRSVDKIQTYSQYVILDIDKLSRPQLLDIKNISRLSVYTYATFISPSGNGVKIVIKVNTGKEFHKEAYKQVVNYYEQALNIDIDTSGSDVCRLCFVSYDSECYINNNSDIFEVAILIKESIVPVSAKGIAIESYIEEIERTCTDISGNYETWCNIGFAISGEYGEHGRDYFHRVSRFFSKYNQKDCDEQYLKCLDSKGGGISIATFYHYAHQSGIKTILQHESNNNAIPNAIKPELVKEVLPTIPEKVYTTLPDFLKLVVQPSSSSEERDILLLGALTVISACLPKVFGIYDQSKVFSNLYLFVTAPASAGKGRLNKVKNLVEPVHKIKREQSKALRQEYDAEIVVYNQHKGKSKDSEKPSRPPEKMLFIPANNSTTGVYQLLSDNDCRGLIFETEGDTLAQAFKSDYGNYSDGFRKAFHHETISYFRRTDNEYVDIENPCLSTLLSGTPKQVATLIPNAENGLFSRFMFYYMNIKPTWKNVFQNNNGADLDDYYSSLGGQFLELHSTLKNNPEIEVILTVSQQEEFNTFFTSLQTKYINLQPEEYIATIRRLGLIAFRMMMIFSVFRIMEDGDVNSLRLCEDSDFKNALSITSILVKHSSKVFNDLPMETRTKIRMNKKERFINLLPLKFIRQDYLLKADQLNIPHKTAEGYITSFVKSGILHRDSHNCYTNTSKEEEEP